MATGSGQIKTPYYVISTEKLGANIAAFKQALSALWPHSTLAYSIKTNALPWLLGYLNARGVAAEAVSDEEYQLAQLCGFREGIVFNGPIKGRAFIEKALRDNAYINVDAQSDLDTLKALRPQGARIGLRVNVDPSVFDRDDIGYHEDGFRFGFSSGNGAFARALDAVRSSVDSVQLGLHLHCNTVTRSVEAYRAIARFAAGLIARHRLRLSFLDIGGGYFGGVEGKPTAQDYIRAIRDELLPILDPAKTRLIVEPGSAIIGSCADLVTTVLDAKDTDHARIVTTDGSRIHIDPLWAKSRYLYTLSAPQTRPVLPRQIVCGYTCMDHDRIMAVENEKTLLPGDTIVYHRVGAYSMTFGGLFIRCLPEVYAEENGLLTRVRRRISMEDYVTLHS